MHRKRYVTTGSLVQTSQEGLVYQTLLIMNWMNFVAHWNLTLNQNSTVCYLTVFECCCGQEGWTELWTHYHHEFGCTSGTES